MLIRTVVATSGGSASVSWQPNLNGQEITSYTAHTLLKSSIGNVPPDVSVPATSTSIYISDLTNNSSYTFQVSASNSLGTSAYSAESNLMTLSPTQPPANVGASAVNASARVVWSAPAAIPGDPVIKYTVFPNPPTALGPVNVSGTATGVVVDGLSNGTSYNFTVVATNSYGPSAPSAPSNSVIPSQSLGAPDLAIAMSGLTQVSAGTNTIYTMTVTNNGPSAAGQVSVSDTIPAGATFVSAVSSQGVCTLAGSSLSCGLAGLDAGISASVTLTLNVSSAITNTASVSAKDAGGAAMVDPNPANNSASVTTSIAAPTTTTDIAVGGSARNGGPAVGSGDTYVWQVKNNKTPVANNVVFTDKLPTTLQLVSVSTNLGTCTGPAAGSLGGMVQCTAASLANGQAMIVSIDVIVRVAGSISNTGSVTFSGTDSNPANNTSTVTFQAK